MRKTSGRNVSTFFAHEKPSAEMFEPFSHTKNVRQKCLSIIRMRKRPGRNVWTLFGVFHAPAKISQRLSTKNICLWNF
jgi:hypothetical protein